MRNQKSPSSSRSRRISPVMLPKIKKEALFRLKSVLGHLEGVVRMLEHEDYCIDIIQQVGAIEVALKKVSTLLLENHLDTCVTMAIEGKDPAVRRRVVRELLEIFQANKRPHGTLVTVRSK